MDYDNAFECPRSIEEGILVSDQKERRRRRMYRFLFFKNTKVISLFMAVLFLISCIPSTVYAETSDAVKGGVGGGLIGALAGSLGGYAGAGALIGGGIGLLGGAISDSSKEDKKKKEDQSVEDAYQKGLKDGKRVTYNEGADSQHVDKFGDDLR